MAKSEERGGILVNHRPVGVSFRLAGQSLYIPAAVYENGVEKKAGKLDIGPDLIRAIKSRPQAVAQLRLLVEKKEMDVVGFSLELLPGVTPTAGSGGSREVMAGPSSLAEQLSG